VDDNKEKVFIQTPFRVGGSMKRWLGVSQRSVSHKLDVLSKIADGFGAIHSRDVVHHDIKLENIVMDSNEENATSGICDFDTS
jgi:serine/threonine protein kinase